MIGSWVKSRHFVRAVWLAPLVCLLSFAVHTDVHAQSSGSPLASDLVLPLYKSGILELQETPSRVSVGNPGIADIVIFRSSQVHVLGKALGSTNVVFWNQQDRIFATVNIEVTHDLNSLKQKLFTMLPSETVNVYSAQENIVLNGKLSSASAVDAAVKVAESYLPECINSESSVTGQSGSEAAGNADACGKAAVINLMSVVGSQQIMLEVKVAEISRTLSKNFDSNLSVFDLSGQLGAGLVTGGGAFSGFAGDSPVLAPLSGQFIPNAPAINAQGLFFSDLSGSNPFQGAIEISKSNGLVKILAEPNLTTLTGKKAEFLSGGEFPVPVPGDGGTSIIFKKYGIEVEFLPTILDSQRISLDLDISVSQVSNDNVVRTATGAGTFIVPTLTTRSAASTIELSNGQTMGIAGLIQDDISEVFTRIPGLGDIPILGSLFSSKEYQSGQTELVIFVTPHFAKPISPDKIKLPTDSFVPPNDFEYYVLGRMEGLRKPKTMSRRRGVDGGFDGVTFGHDL